jgi:sugar lactone lactonase YvrE
VRPLIDERSCGRLTIAGREFEWIDVHLGPSGVTADWAHPGVAVDIDGAVLIPDARGTTLYRRSPDGSVHSVLLAVTDCHALAPSASGDMWVADHGHKFVPAPDGSYTGELHHGRVVLFSPEGEARIELLAPDDREWRPSGVALHDYGRASDGRLWVADGYGSGRVLCFSEAGELLWSTDGASSGTPFSTPHGLIVDARGEVPVLRIADRGNRRIVTLSLDGDFIDASRLDLLTSPSGFAITGGQLWVTELFGGVVVLDRDGSVIDRVGSTRDPADHPEGWPNTVENSRTARPEVRPLSVNSPHGIAATTGGDVWLTEWLIGGRVTRLRLVG